MTAPRPRWPETERDVNDDRTGIRKGLTRYGDDAFSLYVRKAFIKAMGYTDDALERPMIGIANIGLEDSTANLKLL